MSKMSGVIPFLMIGTLLTLAGCGSSEPVADIANSLVVDVNAVDLDNGTIGDASAIEQMGAADANMTMAPPPASGDASTPPAGNSAAAVQNQTAGVKLAPDTGEPGPAKEAGAAR